MNRYNEHGKNHTKTDKNTRFLPQHHTPCPFCSGTKDIIRSGIRKGKYGATQIYYCKNCQKYFTARKIKRTHYQPKIILEAISYYNLGYTLDKTVALLRSRHKVKVPRSTIHTWITEYNDIFTFLSLRKKYILDPSEIIQSKKFYHQQPYEFKYHRLKLNIAAKRYQGIKTYINEILTSLDNSLFKTGPRCSSPPENIKQTLSKNILSKIRVRKIKTNNAITMASLSVELARTKHDRHNKVENFFLINDSATLAIEVPVYLRPKEARAFKFPLKEPLTGHIDMLQMRRNKIHILDYKPEMATDKSAHIQLLLYAFALSKRTNIPLTNINCAYFNEDRYYQFAPSPYYYQN